MTSGTDQIIARSKDALLPVYRHHLFSRVMVSGQGVRVVDSEGRSYLDFGSGVGVNVLGYRHPVWTAALHAQLDSLVHASNFFYSIPQLELAEKLKALCELDKVFLSCSGAEANEAAIKVARRAAAQRGIAHPEIICLSGAWHGRTIATISATDSEPMQRGFAPLLPGFRVVKPFDLPAIEGAITQSTIAVMIEPVLGHGGVYPAPPDFLSDLRRLCDDRGLLLILDEIQSGVGRTGYFLASQGYCGPAGTRIRADIVTLGKGLGGGLPVSATLMTDELARLMEVGAHGTTFGGNLLCARAALEVVAIVSAPGFLEEVQLKGRYFLEALHKLCSDFPGRLVQARGRGLLLALEMQGDVAKTIPSLAEGGLIATPVGSSTLRFMPPLIVERGEIDEALSILRATVAR